MSDPRKISLFQKNIHSFCGKWKTILCNPFFDKILHVQTSQSVDKRFVFSHRDVDKKKRFCKVLSDFSTVSPPLQLPLKYFYYYL